MVLAVLLEHLAAARRAGRTFEAAWPAARAAALDIAEKRDRQAWRYALGETQWAWQAAYENRPARRTGHLHELRPEELTVG